MLFPSLKARGKAPVSESIFCADHLRPTVIAAGVQVPRGHHFGLPTLRPSLSNWLVNKPKVEPKTVQALPAALEDPDDAGSLSQKDADEARAEQGAFLAEDNG